ALIYFYLISAASLALIVIGIFNAVNLVINSTQYDKYPLRWGSVSTCDYLDGGVDYKVYPPMVDTSFPVGPDRQSTPSAQEIEKQKQLCLKNEEADRKQHKVDDLRNTFAFSIIGLILFLIHFPQARKMSKEQKS
ncbi:hypothetical protein HYS93_05085, partial [Candidatus Daviesbacteria bacterium]|nr:hypothetical protein [Candidatus Daviesbacteria bacterium]